MSNAFKVGAISASITLDNNPFKQGIRDSIKESMSLRGAFTAMRQDIADVARDFTIAGAAITGFFASTVKAAADVEEAESLFNVSMGSMAESTRQWSEDLSDALHLNANTVRELVGEVNLLPKAMGFTEEASASMSKELTKLAFDMSSFRNIPFDEAMGKFRAGLTGESEPMKALGVIMNETAVEAFAVANGIAKMGEDLTESQKVVARFGIIMRDTKDAQGDLARTSGSATNQFRQFSEQILAIGQNIGKDLLPPVTEFVAKANNAISAVRVWAKDNATMAASLTKITAGTGAATLGMGSMALGVLGLARAFDVLKKAAAIAWAVALAPEALIAAGLAAVGVGIYGLRAVWKQNFNGMGDDIDWLIGKLGALKDATVGFFQKAGGWVADMARAASKHTTDFLGIDREKINANAKDAIGGFFAELQEGTEIGWQKVKDFFSGGAKAVTDQVKEDLAAAPGLQDLYKKVTDGLAAPTFEGYQPFDPEELLKGARALDTMGESAKAAGGQAKKAAEELNRLKEEASDMRLELFPEESFAEEVRKIAKMAQTFPEIMTGDAVARAFDALLEDFKDKGIDTTKLIKNGMLSITPAFETAMTEAAQRVGIAAAEAAMNAREAIADGEQFDAAGAMRGKGREAFDAISDPLGMGDMLDTSAALTSQIVEMVQAGDLSGVGAENILSRASWDDLQSMGRASLDEIVQSLMTVTAEGTKFPPMMKAWVASIPKSALFQVMAEDVGLLGEKLKALGAGAIGSALTGFRNLFNVGVSITKELKAFPGLFKLMEAAGISTALKVGIAMHFALNVLALIADAVMLVLELFGAWGKEGVKELKGMAKVIDEIKEASDAWVDSLTDKLVDAIKTGQFAWRDFVNEVLDDIARIAIKELVVSPLVNLVGGAIGFADGGAFSKGHIVDSPEYFNTKSGPAVRGEAGTEVVMPAVRLGDGTLGVRSSGGGGSGVVVNIHDNRGANDPAVEVRRSTGSNGEQIYDVIVNAFNRAAALGDLDNALNLTQLRRGR